MTNPRYILLQSSRFSEGSTPDSADYLIALRMFWKVKFKCNFLFFAKLLLDSRDSFGEYLRETRLINFLQVFNLACFYKFLVRLRIGKKEAKLVKK